MRPSFVFAFALASAFALELGLSHDAHAGTCDAPTAASAESPAASTVGALAGRLAERIDACATTARQPDAARFFAAHHIDPTPERERDYVRMRTLFELTRDGGPFRVRWAITNEEPSAKKVWASWRATPPLATSSSASVTAECDEISAVLANLARKMGVRHVGLFWPRWNHTIAAWEPVPGVRVLLPTTQIFLGCDDTFDAVSFAPTAQKIVHEFPANDVADATPIPSRLASFFLEQTRHYAGASLEVLSAIRAHRAVRLGSSVGASCVAPAVARARSVRSAGPPRPEDHRALLHYGATELALAASSTADDVLDAMAR